MNTFLIEVVAWTLMALIAFGVGTICWLGFQALRQGWQLLDQIRRERQEREQGR